MSQLSAATLLFVALYLANMIRAEIPSCRAKLKSAARFVSAFAFIAAVHCSFAGITYTGIAWEVFQFRNLKANRAVFFLELPAVLTWKRLPEYQR